MSLQHRGAPSLRLPAETNVPMAPRIQTQQVVLPTTPLPNNNPEQAKCRSFNRKTRDNAQWRKDLLQIYSDILLARTAGSISLRQYCFDGNNSHVTGPSEYKRLSVVWKELGLEDCISKSISPTSQALVDKINARFPVIGGARAEKPHRTRVRTTKNELRTNSQWKDLLSEMYYTLSNEHASNHCVTVKGYCRDVLNAESQYRRIVDVWKQLGLDRDLSKGIPHDDAAVIAKIEKKFGPPPVRVHAPAPTRDLGPSSNSFFDQDEEAMFCECVTAFARAGFPLEKANLKAYADAFLEADGIGDGTDSSGGISMDTVERIYKQGRLSAKTNVNPIDPKRAAQADPQVLNAFYHQLDEWVKIAHEIDPETWPEDRYANIPPTRIYNTDEQGPNPTHLRNPVLIPEDMVEERSRQFQNTREGDGKMQFHYSVANIVRADGVQHHPDLCVEGAPAPYVLISDASSSHELDSMDKANRDKQLANQSESNSMHLNQAVLEGWFDDYQVGKKDDIVNRFGFQIRTTPTGSMLKRTFYDFILHFAKQLPHDQGKDGLGVVLFLDWHCSRECPQSLIMAFFMYNILIFVLPSKTSIWSQPCDNAKNELTARDIAMTAHNLGLFAGNSLDYRDANRVFRGGLEKNCLDQNDELRRTGTNAVVSSFKKTGLYPMDYNNEGWQVAFLNFNKLNEMIKQQKREAGEQLPEIIWIAKARAIDKREPLTKEDSNAIESFLSCDDFLRSGDRDAGNNSQPIKMPILFLAVSIAEHLLGNYVLNPKRDTTIPPEPTTAYEKAALKLVEYVAVTVDDRVDTRCTLAPDAIARDKLRTKLAAVRFGHSIALRKKSCGATLNLMKQTPTKFVVLHNERRHSRNISTMTVAQVLKECFDKQDDASYTLTKQDKRKGQKKARVARKKLNQSLYDMAREEADGRRLKRNVQDVTKRLSTKRPRFAQRLATIMEEEDVDMEDLYCDFEAVAMEPYTDIISVTQGDVTKDVSVTRVGSDLSAVSYKMETTLMKLMIEMKARSNAKAKRKRRRGAGQSTHLGKSGLSVGILIQRQNKEEELKVLEKEKKNVCDELKRLEALLEQAEEMRHQLPDSFWKWDIVKGKRRTTLARLLGVYKSGAKADELAASLKDLKLTKASVEAKLEELRVSVNSKRGGIAPVIARMREQQDFLDCTAEYAANPLAEKEVDDCDDDESDTED